MAKLTLTPLTSAYQAVATLNANNTLIETALENTLSRDGTTPNTMSANLDMNSNDILNLNDAIAGTSPTTLSQVQSLLAAAATDPIVGPIAATLVTVADAGGFYVGVDVESVLQEIGADLIADGTVTDSVLRWSGTAWVEESSLTVDAAGNLDTTGVIRIDDGLLRITSTGNQAALEFSDGGNALQIRGTGTGAVETIALSGGGNWTWGTPQRIEDNFDFLERPSVSAPLATYGRVWVRNDTPNVLMFTDDAGTDFEVAGDGVEQGNYYVKTADTVRSSTTVVTDDTHLSGMVLEPGRYEMEGFLTWSQQAGAGGNGIQLRFNQSAGTIDSGATFGSFIVRTSALAIDTADWAILDPGGSTRAVTTTIADPHRAHFKGCIEVLTTSTFAIQWAQNVSDPDTVIMQEGSFMKFTKIS